jgi:hypothetical protein
VFCTHLNREVHEAERWMREEFTLCSMSVHREGSLVLKAVQYVDGEKWYPILKGLSHEIQMS